MAKKNKNKSHNSGVDEILELTKNLSLNDLEALNKSIPTIMGAKIRSGLNSDDINDIAEVGFFLEKSKSNKGSEKSISFLPDSFSYNGKGYKENISRISFEVLQRMGNLYCVKNIINTRIDQVTRFLRFSLDDQKEGFTIRKKRSIFEEKDEDLSKYDKKEIERIVTFLENGGETDKWESKDSFIEFVRKILQDSLTVDQIAFEIVRNRAFEIKKFRAIDASTIRILDSQDPKFMQDFEKYRYRGHLPRFCQVWAGQIVTNPITDEKVMYYPWELGYGVRNVTTSIWDNGYGKSELETLAEIITNILNGVSYNGNFFKNGSNPKGFINIKDEGADNSTLNEFKQFWRQLLTGTQNAHKTPIFSGLDVEWIDLQKGNRDMEFNEWTKFLIILTCSVYRIDPSELGFNFDDAKTPFGQKGQKERLDHSKQKGLYPLLIFIEKLINKYLVSELNDDFEFAFTGVNVEDEMDQIRLDSEKIKNGVVSIEDMFFKYNNRELNPEKDTILNPVYQQAIQSKMYGSQEMNELVDDQNGEDSSKENPFHKSNPIMQQALQYINETLGYDGED